MADGPDLALQKAVIDALKADTGVTAIAADRVYDDIPQGATYPLVKFGRCEIEPVRTDGAKAWAATFSVEAHTRAVAGRVQVKRLAHAIITALDETAAAMAGYDLRQVQFVTSAAVSDPATQTQIATIAFVALIDE